MDDAKVDPTLFQNMIYKHCYQYARSTTPVSLCKYSILLFSSLLANSGADPAAYYAHLASNRARCHESSAASEGPRGGQKFEEQQQDAGVRARGGAGAAGGPPGASSQSGSLTGMLDAKPLVPLGSDLKDAAALKAIRSSMWYI
jgi:eukaryotic translation initiation factor 2C